MSKNRILTLAIALGVIIVVLVAILSRHRGVKPISVQIAKVHHQKTVEIVTASDRI